MSEESDLDLPEFDGDAAEGPADVPAKTPAPSADPAGLAATLADEDEKSATDLAPVFDVPVNVSAVLGKTHIELHSLLKLQAG